MAALVCFIGFVLGLIALKHLLNNPVVEHFGTVFHGQLHFLFMSGGTWWAMVLDAAFEAVEQRINDWLGEPEDFIHASTLLTDVEVAERLLSKMISNVPPVPGSLPSVHG